jgi:hypothetical protein
MIVTRGLGKPAALLPTAGLGIVAPSGAFLVYPAVASTSATATWLQEALQAPVSAATAATLAEAAIVFGFPVSPATAGTTAAAQALLATLLAQPTPATAGTFASADYLVEIIEYLIDLYRANPPDEDPTDALRERKPVRVQLPPELEKLRDRLPDKLPSLDEW